jgi:hypothetical protein
MSKSTIKADLTECPKDLTNDNFKQTFMKAETCDAMGNPIYTEAEF